MPCVSISAGTLLIDHVAGWAKRDSRPSDSWLDLFQPRAVHELLFDPTSGAPVNLAFVTVRLRSTERPIVWIDPSCGLYPPAFGAEISRLHLLRARPTDMAWAAAECLRCAHVGAVVALMSNRLTRIEVRRLQLAAEQGNALCILLRPNLASAGVHIYSVASRWLVSPTSGDRTIQRWRVEHVHGHGRQFGPSFIVEKHRATGQTHFMHPSASLADRPSVATAS